MPPQLGLVSDASEGEATVTTVKSWEMLEITQQKHRKLMGHIRKTIGKTFRKKNMKIRRYTWNIFEDWNTLKYRLSIMGYYHGHITMQQYDMGLSKYSI